MAKVTLQTVAEAVGVSRTTVSNAYSRPDQLADDLRRRILAVAAELGYPGPHAAGRTLRRGRAGAIGLLFTEHLPYAFADPYAVALLQGLAEAGEEAGVSLLLLPLPPHRGADAVGDAVVDGFCVYSMSEGHAGLDAARRRGLPLVVIDEPALPGVPFVGIDDRAAARTAAAHLVELGHRRVGVVADRLRDDDHEGPVDAARQAGATFPNARDRLGGYRDALTATGVAWDAVAVREASPNSRAAGARAAGPLLDAARRPTAILALSDVMALGVLDAAAARGLAVPHDLSVVGFDDIPEAAAAGLTTVRQPSAEKGRLTGRLLLQPEGRPEAPRHLLPTELVVRGSTGAAPAEAPGR